MRTVRMSAPGSGGKRARKKGRSDPGHRIRGLRWVPVPLALLVAALGMLVLGTMQGQAAANLAAHPNEAGGLSLSVDTMQWLNDAEMTGSGNPAAPPPADSGYDMPSSMMPGMEAVGDNRLRIAVDLSNVNNTAEEYSTTDFTLSAPGGKTWQVDDQDHSALPASAYLQPGFSTTIDVYFDVPAADSKNLTLHWSRGGRTISLPVKTGNAASSTGVNMNM